LAKEQGLIWFGHSSYLMRYAGLTWLVDPVFSKFASPIPGSVKAFKGTDFVYLALIPEIDILLISHDHYDHLDYPTIKALLPRVKQIVCPLGVDAHFLAWGAKAEQLLVLDWWQTVKLPSVTITATPARHFSGRTLKRNQSLWASFVLERKTDGTRIFVGGDSGYSPHFEEIANKYAPFSLAIIECGQYDQHWHQIHAWPEDSATAASLLKAKVVLPVHWGKFALSLHHWKEPIRRFLSKAKAINLQAATPMFGEVLDWQAADIPNRKWWED
jgi:L-ascorbate metabolism protein UlaG (beta-lactamase superfamily)